MMQRASSVQVGGREMKPPPELRFVSYLSPQHPPSVLRGGHRARGAARQVGLERFAPVTYEHFASEEKALRGCESVVGIRPR